MTENITARASVPGRSQVTTRAVVTRADGSVEDWGVVGHPSTAHALLYIAMHPWLMVKRIYWRFKWQLSSPTQA